MRLDRYIANSGFAARSAVKKLIRGGKVSVNGAPVKRADAKIDENADEVRVGGELIRYDKFIYLMLNKPQGYVSATEDKRYKPVTELIPPEYAHYNAFPVGRLDIDTEGLLILSNDGDFAHRVITPKKNIYKRYYAELDKAAETADIQAFEAGMEFKDFTAKPARLEITADPTRVYIEIAEGKYHQVKRMCERVGKTVLFLKRIKIGGLALDENLPSGAARPLTDDEIKSIFE
ncbi:MAG: rRNA pseudouridine synthase [Firmicutes bacterium]|nr:rRNA pseudouridine synthase [Bacillota bacterium]